MDKLSRIKDRIKFYKDFPSEGIVFIDLLPLLSDSDIFKDVIGLVNDKISCPNVAAPEARGFLFAAPLLVIPGGIKNFIAFRKSGKLPSADGDLVQVPVIKEYGDDSLFFRVSDLQGAHPSLGDDPAIEVTIFDDVLATGGTAKGMAENLNKLVVQTPVGKLPVRVREFVFLAEIPDLQGRARLEAVAPVTSLLTF